MGSAKDIEQNANLLREKYAEERDKRLRRDGKGQYVATTTAQFASYTDDPYVEPGFSRPAVDEDIDVLILGAGFSGLTAANALLKQGVQNFRMIDKAGDFGGTWYWNRYPGCRCDVEAYIYMPLLEDVSTKPVEKYARASFIFEHAKRIGTHLKLYDKAYFQTKLTEMRWNAEINRWVIKTDRDDTIRARFVSFGIGPFNRPKLPGIPGIETFKGHSFHTSRWDYGYTGGDEDGNLTGLKDKRVAIIGTGATAIQAIPALAEGAKQLYIVQRTPGAVAERGNKPTDLKWWETLRPGWTEERATNFESFLLGIPQKEDLVGDGWTTTWAKFSKAAAESAPTGTAKNEPTIRQLVDYEKMGEIRARIDRTVKDPATAEALKPYYNWFCKRPLFHDGYYEAFNRDNVTLINTDGKGLERITEDSIVFDGVSYPVDCIIYASGFDFAAPAHRSGGFELFGCDGLSLSDKWVDGRKSLHGMLVRGFPNLGIIGSLKHASFSWNVTYILRRQNEHFASIVKRCLSDDIVMFNVTQEAEERWGRTILENSRFDPEFVAGCTPGDYNNEGQNFSDTIWASTFGGGLFEYLKILKEWRDNDGLVRDCDLIHGDDETETGAHFVAESTVRG